MLSSPAEIIRQLTTPSTGNEYRELVYKFARIFGWRPSDYSPVYNNDYATAHLLVEHGLKNTAVITFLHSPNYFSELPSFQVQKLLNFSYNNLIDWHFVISNNEAVALYNRVKDSLIRVVHRVDLRRGEGVFDELRSERFEQIIGKRPSPNLPALDDALIKNISNWKRILSVDIKNVSNKEMSALFNAIIFARAVEDSARSSKLRNGTGAEFPEMYLVDVWNNNIEKKGIGEILYEFISNLLGEEIPSYLSEEEELEVFNKLDISTVKALLFSFYYQDSIPYKYDFSIMSKHALSRIYEQYVSILKIIEPLTGDQGLLFQKDLPKQETNKAYGAYYTPQYIARFFARFYEKKVSPKTFLTAKIIDPACGSGIFLRTFLEQRFEQTVENYPNEINAKFIKQSFADILGIDIDPNATHATRLSLALLQLALKDSFPNKLSRLKRLPETLDIIDSEVTEFIKTDIGKFRNSRDIVVANPPFVRIEDQPEVIRERLASYMEGYASGRIGSELAFLRIGLEMLKEGGIGLFVLPHSFMFSESAKRMREEISHKAWVLCLADLSAIDVFKDTGIYTLLLVFQKKTSENEGPKAVVVKCYDFVEKALEYALDGNEIEKNVYSVYEVPQSKFKEKQWAVVSKSELNLEKKYEQLPKLSNYFEIIHGFISAADSIFIRPLNSISKKERKMYAPFLPDREMSAYTVPKTTNKVIFYPFINGREITVSELKNNFPETWEYLSSNKASLKKRSSVREENWWKLSRPREPEKMFRPKIVTPHLTISPRFSLDIEGKYAVSRSPLLYPKENLQPDIEGIGNEDILKFFVAVLNSSVCYGYIANHSHKYKKGYAMLEGKTLKNIPVPSPMSNPLIAKEIIELVNQRLVSEGIETVKIEQKIDALVTDLYGLSEREKKLLRIEH